MLDAARSSKVRIARLALATGIALVSLIAFVPAAGAATITVNATNDEFGEDTLDCALREAVQAANTNATFGGCPAGDNGQIGDVTDTINVPAGSDYMLTRSGVDNTNSMGDLDVGIADDLVNIQSTGSGAGGTAVICSGCGDRVIEVTTPRTSVITGLRFSGGAGAAGGGISSPAGLLLINVTISGNTATGNGGGISFTGTGTNTLALRNVTISGNSAAGRGGGVAYNSANNSFFENSTIVGNTGDTDESGPPEDVGGGIANFGAGVTNISNTILAGNFIPGVDGGDECSANVTSGNNNLLGDGGNCTSFTPGTSDLVGSFFGGEIPANLDGLGNYGGKVWTHQPNRTSPAINRGFDFGPGTTCQTTDAREIARPQDGRCDMGAVEVVPAGPQTLAVNTTADQLDGGFTGTCSLREAVTSANNNQATGGCPAGVGGGVLMDNIQLPPGTYTLTRPGVDDTNFNGDLDLHEGISIAGTGAGQTTIDGNGAVTGDRVIHVRPPLAFLLADEISGVNIRNGITTGNGGGVEVAAALSLTAVTVSGNFAGGDGGGVHYGTSVAGSVLNSTISGNQANGFGGGIDSEDGFYPEVDNVTVTQNTADANGGGQGGGGVSGFAGGRIANSIIAGNTDTSGGDAPDCVGQPSIPSIGFNLIGNANNCNFVAAGGDQVGTAASPIAPALGALANNGGSTLTHAPVFGSPALNMGNPAAVGFIPACLATDQLGIARPLAGRCDVGALETNPAAPVTPPTVTSTPTAPPTTPAAPKKCKKKKKGKKGALASKKKKKKC